METAAVVEFLSFASLVDVLNQLCFA